MDPAAEPVADAAPEDPVVPRRWRPKRVLVTRSSLQHEHGVAIAERCRAQGLEVVELPGDRVTGITVKDDPRATYRAAKRTLVVAVAPPSALRLQPIPPSADLAVHLAEGCPAHCQYCYLAGSLAGPPLVRAFANVGDLEASVGAAAEAGRSAHPDRPTSFEASCYTDPLGIEHLTGSLAHLVGFVAGRDDATLRFATKFAEVGPLLDVEHGGRTQARFSVNARFVAERLEGGTAPLEERLAAARALAERGWPVGLVVAPIVADPGWEDGYAELLELAGAALRHVDGLTVELITHRFTEGSRAVLQGWYPTTKLDLSDDRRTIKRTRTGSRKHVYDRPTTADLRSWFSAALERHLPEARTLYWT